jgi:hypothetical protein
VGVGVSGTAVAARCPLCRWTSHAIEEDPDAPNGRWHAFSEAAAEYRAHFAMAHRPLPELVVRRAG